MKNGENIKKRKLGGWKSNWLKSLGLRVKGKGFYFIVQLGRQKLRMNQGGLQESESEIQSDKGRNWIKLSECRGR